MRQAWRRVEASICLRSPGGADHLVSNVRHEGALQRVQCTLLEVDFVFNRRRGSHFGGNIATASTSNKAPGRASSGTPIVVLAGGAAVLTYLSRTSRNSAIFLPISTM